MYPKDFTISETTESTSVASYLDLLSTRDKSNSITTKLHDKRDAFGFHIVNFPFTLSNIPSTPAYGAHASQIIRYAHCSSNYSDFLVETRLLSQGYKVNHLSNTFCSFQIFTHGYLVERVSYKQQIKYKNTGAVIQF